MWNKSTRVQDAALLALAVLGVFAVIALSLVVAPDAANFRAPLTHRIFYYHVPAAWAGFLAFAVTALAGAWHLKSGSRNADRWAAASAEVGLVLSTIALVTGILWARVEFTAGYSVAQDAKVITLLVLILAYAGYLTLRSGVDDRVKRGRLSAVFGLLAFLGVPLAYLASKVSVHPDFTREEQSLAPELGMILGVSVLAFTVLYAALARTRVRLIELEDAVEDLRGVA